jgi:hypothetical protein
VRNGLGFGVSWSPRLINADGQVMQSFMMVVYLPSAELTFLRRYHCEGADGFLEALAHRHTG